MWDLRAILSPGKRAEKPRNHAVLEMRGFLRLLPKRWKVEQTIGALTISRRLKVDYETLLHVSAAVMLFASITRLLASITMT